MSLIDEALKRARLDAARGEPQERRGPYPWVAAPSVQAAAARRSRRALLTGLLAGSLGVALLGGAGLWLTHRHGASAAARPAEAASEAPEASGSAAAAPAPSHSATVAAGGVSAGARPADEPAAVAAATAGTDRAGEPRPGAPPGAASKRAGAASSGGKTLAGDRETARVAARAAFDSRAARESSSPSTSTRAGAASADAVSPAAPALADGHEYSREVTLPGGGKLALSGIAYSEHQPVAVINGKVVGPGEVVSEFTVARIQVDRVELRGHGLSIFLLLN